MDLSAIAKVVAPLAPMAGSIIGGLIPFPGSSMIGQKLGEMIAGQFGVPPTPAALSEAIAVAGEETARAKINAAVEQARIHVDGFVKYEEAILRAVEVSVTQTGETMRAEIGREHPFFNGWRPAIGWVFAFVALAFGLMLVFAAGVTVYRTSYPLRALNEAWPLFASYFGVLGLVVGVYIPSRSIEKKSAIESAAPMPNVKPPAAGSASLQALRTAKPAPAVKPTGRPEVVS